MIACHLREHLPRPPAAPVDAGGGAGNKSIPLARDGYQVAIVDPPAAMLAKAQARLEPEPAEVVSRVRLVQASASEARHALGGMRFAGVLCHGVIMYVDDPQPFAAALADLAQPGAIVSLVAKNADVTASRPALEGNWAGPWPPLTPTASSTGSAWTPARTPSTASPLSWPKPV